MQFTNLQKDMMQAMKDHDKVKKDALSTLVSATKKLAIDAGCRDDIPDEMTDQAILKEIKSVKEQIETCPDSRAELKAEYFTPALEDMINDTFLGLSVVALALVIWLVILLIKDPRGTVRAKLLKK